jgi:hypothetical protein
MCAKSGTQGPSLMGHACLQEKLPQLLECCTCGNHVMLLTMPTWKHCITARLLVLKDPADMLAWLTPVIADAASADFGFVDASTYAAAGECCSRYPATGAAAATELQQHGVACTAAAASQHQGMQVARSLQPQHDSATKPNHK